jgi:hypothetical protein
MKYPLVRVEWDDAWGSVSWTPIEVLKETEKPASIITVGWLLLKDKEKLVVATTIDEENETACLCMTIPRGCVKGMVRL